MRIRLTIAALILSMPVATQVKCTFSSAGNGCGPRLAADASRQGSNIVVDHNMTRAPANAFGLLAVGVQQTKFRISPGCDLLVVPFTFIRLQSNSSGAVGRITVTFPANVTGRFFGQAGFDDGGSVKTSNALQLDCK